MCSVSAKYFAKDAKLGDGSWVTGQEWFKCSLRGGRKANCRKVHFGKKIFSVAEGVAF